MTGDCILFAYVQPVDNTPAGKYTIMSKWGANGFKAFIFSLDNNPTGTLELIISENNSTGTTYNATVATGIADGVGYWAFVVVDISTNLTFYTSTASPTTTPALASAAATMLGTAVTSSNTAIFDTTSAFEVGAFNSGASGAFNGSIYRAGIINGLDPTATLAVDFAPTTAVATGNSFVSSDGATYTLAGGTACISSGVATDATGATDDFNRMYFEEDGYTGTVQDMEKDYLADLGYTGGLEDMQKQYWADYS